MNETPDAIVKTVLLRAVRPRVWSAIGDSTRFGAWFGVRLEGPFVAGETVRGTIVPTEVDAGVAEQQRKFAGHPVELDVVSVVAERELSFRWRPFAIEPGVDYSAEPKTLVTIALEDAEGGTRLTVTERGFSGIPAHRRARAFQANEGGWTIQTRLVGEYLAKTG